RVQLAAAQDVAGRPHPEAEVGVVGPVDLVVAGKPAPPGGGWGLLGVEARRPQRVRGGGGPGGVGGPPPPPAPPPPPLLPPPRGRCFPGGVPFWGVGPCVGPCAGRSAGAASRSARQSARDCPGTPKIRSRDTSAIRSRAQATARGTSAGAWSRSRTRSRCGWN